MILRSIIFLYIFPVALSAALPYKESGADLLTPLIQSTERLLQRQKDLKLLLEKYDKLHQNYMKDIDNRALALETGQVAQEALDKIKEDKLNYLFDPAYISEMTLFAKLASKPSIPKLP